MTLSLTELALSAVVFAIVSVLTYRPSPIAATPTPTPVLDTDDEDKDEDAGYEYEDEDEDSDSFTASTSMFALTTDDEAFIASVHETLTPDDFDFIYDLNEYSNDATDDIATLWFTTESKDEYTYDRPTDTTTVKALRTTALARGLHNAGRQTRATLHEWLLIDNALTASG